MVSYNGIIAAVRSKNYEKIDKLLEECTNGKFVRKHLLLEALNDRDFEVFEYLAKRIDIDEKCDDYGQTLLMKHLIRNNKIITIQQLEMILKYTKNINITDLEDGNTAFDIYIRDFTKTSDLYIPILKLFIEHGANPFLLNEYGGRSINSYFHEYNDMETLNIIFKNIKSDYIHVSLMSLICALRGNPNRNYDYIELLLPYVKDINEVDDTGHNILWHARNYSCTYQQDIIDLLITNGARE